MKTTVDIPDGLFNELKRQAARRKTTLRAVLELALRTFFAGDRARRPFELRDASVRGRGVQRGVAEGDWQAIREQIYEGRGG